MCVMLMMTFWEGPRAFAKQHLPLLSAKAVSARAWRQKGPSSRMFETQAKGLDAQLLLWLD